MAPFTHARSTLPDPEEGSPVRAPSSIDEDFPSDDPPCFFIHYNAEDSSAPQGPEVAGLSHIPLMEAVAVVENHQQTSPLLDTVGQLWLP